MRELYRILLVCLLCIILETPVYAAELKADNIESCVNDKEVLQTDETIQKNEVIQDRASLLYLDNQNTYEGMTSAYKDGYQPMVKDGKAIIVVPLLCDGIIKQDTLTATVDLGNADNSPFVYRNYEKSFTKSTELINGTEEIQDVFLVSFAIELTEKYYNGIYPVTIQIRGTDENGSEIIQSYTSYVVITDGIDPNKANNPDSADVKEEKPTSAPIVLVTKSVINTNPVKAGEDFEAIVTLTNTSTVKSVQNMIVTIGVPSSDFELKNESNVIFVGNLGCGKTTEIIVKVHVSKSVTDGNYPFEITMNYDDPKAITLSSSGVFQVTVKQPLTVKMTMPNISKEMTVGDTIPMTFQVMNLGRSGIYNVRCDVICNGLTQTKTAFIGNMEGGTAGEGMLNVFVLPMEGESAYGKTSGMVRLTYEDSFGNEQIQENSFETNIMEKPEIMMDSQIQNQEEESASQWWISIFVITGIILIVGCSAGAYYMGQKKR